MRIAIFGLGYVGSVSAACLAAAGHDVIGVDVDRHKLALVGDGRSPVTEPGLDELLAGAVAGGRLHVTADPTDAVRQSALSLVCVGTPSRRNGSIDTAYLEKVLAEIAASLSGGSDHHVVAIRSTLIPGVLESRLIPLMERVSPGRVGTHIGVCVNPEFLREGSALKDFAKPPFTLIGERDRRDGDVLLEAYAHLHAPVHRVTPDEASMVKYASNGFHALKVAFANEIGAVSQQLGIDGRQVMQIFCEDRELNISARYLRPGFGFGGSCLPKDLRALLYAAKEQDVATPLLASVLNSNDTHIQRVVDAVLDTGQRRVALLGLSFKPGSDDLRESPFVRLAEALLGRGLLLRVCDPDVALGAVFGRNRAYIDERLPHLAQILAPEWEETMAGTDVIVIGKPLPGLERLGPLLRGHQTVIDLVGMDLPGTVFRPWHTAVPRVPVASAHSPD